LRKQSPDALLELLTAKQAVMEEANPTIPTIKIKQKEDFRSFEKILEGFERRLWFPNFLLAGKGGN